MRERASDPPIVKQAKQVALLWPVVVVIVTIVGWTITTVLWVESRIDRETAALKERIKALEEDVKTLWRQR